MFSLDGYFKVHKRLVSYTFLHINHSYETHTSLAVPEFNTVIKVASVRAIVIIFSILPLITVLRLPRKTSALICGVILFVIGGIIPLSIQIGMLPPMMLVASGVEIFFQNFLTGIVAALLLARYKETKIKEYVEKPHRVAFEEEV